MELPRSKELELVMKESRDVATRLDQPLTSAHLLLCLFTLKNRASMFLSDQQVTADRLLEALAKRPREAPDTWARILRRAREVADVSGAGHISSLHTLVALCSDVDSAAYELVAALDLDLATVRNTALSYLMNPDTTGEAYEGVAETGEVASAAPRARDSAAEAGGRAAQRPRRAPAPQRPHSHQTPPSQPAAAPSPRGTASPRPPKTDRGARKRATKDLAARMFGGSDSGAHATVPSAQRSHEVAHRVPSSTLPLPPSVRRVGPPATKQDRQTSVARHQLVLREKQYKLLNQFGRNLTLLAYDGLLDPVVGRDAEIEQLVDILNKRRTNNPVLVGDAGVGKTAVVEGLARQMVGLDDAGTVPGLTGKILIELEASKLVSGTGVRGAFSERIQALKQEVARAKGGIILFLDELHHWIGVGAGGDGSADGAGELKTALARGEFPCIGATTYDEYRQFIETDPAFARRFQNVRVDEPAPERAIQILRGIKPTYEDHHEVAFDDDAIVAAVKLTHRYLPERRLPDKAISVLDLAGSRARRIEAATVQRPLIASIVGELAGISADKLLMADRERFLDLEEQLMQHIIGHTAVIERVAHTLRRNYAGFVSGRPIGSFLFLGSTGVGKTEFAKALTEVLFEDDSALVRVDMSEYMEAHSVARLIGSPPGYVGHDAGGQLTEAVRRRPYQLVLLDEIEKAHPDVLNILIQLLDEGRLTDARGRTVDFSNTVVIMTSNLGAEAASGSTNKRVGFGAQDAMTDGDLRSSVLNAAKPSLRPELWNRFDDTLVFAPLNRDEVARIARLQLTRSSQRLLEERGISFSCSPDVIDVLIARGGYDPQLGARPMRRTIERLVEGPIADMILRGEAVGPTSLEVTVLNDDIHVELSAPHLA